MRSFSKTLQRFRRPLGSGLGMLAFLSLNMVSLPVSLDLLPISRICTLLGMPSLAALSTAPSLSSERIFGMQPLTFFCVAIPIVVQVALLLIWALRWRSPD
ncbi:MAG: hypothetical protein N3D12_01555 [Candidatus Methanomethyliaceae archaeon]|nr:hypothetical protein [Candidatus Methanomethyliaceae archaeon]